MNYLLVVQVFVRTPSTAGWMNDYNEVHPHSRLAYRSPREYIIASSQPAACPV
jgi:transposase InsO family protein